MKTAIDINGVISEVARGLDRAALRKTYGDQGEFLVIEHFLPREVLDQWDEDLESLKPHIHRNYIPKHKKGGSVGYDSVRADGPSINAVYQSQSLRELLCDLVEAPIQECPDSDPHRCAMYAYTEEGDHIGWHYDTSYYKDRRWTLLVGFQDESTSKLQCTLHTRNPDKANQSLELRVEPGTLVLFNGDMVHHAVTPTKAGERRYIVSMQYVTTGKMNPFMRFVSNMKDSIAYFGLKEVFLGRGRKAAK
jgi:alkylated DNA repair dioxygenase AlkB